MQSDMQRARLALGANFTPAVKVLLSINVFSYLCLAWIRSTDFLGLTYGQVIFDLLGLNPTEFWAHYTVWQVFTYSFLHASFLHLLFNMLALWWFGADIELHLGTRAFVRYYLFTAAGAGLVSAALGIPTIGASGAVYGLLLAFGLLFPNRVLYIYFVIPIKAKYCVFFFGLLEFLAMMSSGPSEINHVAHLSGIGFGLLWFFFPRRRFSPTEMWRNYRRNRMRKRLRVLTQEAGKTPGERSLADFDKPTIH